MEFLRVLASRCGAVFQRKALDTDLDDELSCHLELAVEENMSRGMSEPEARTAALRNSAELHRSRSDIVCSAGCR